MRAAPTERRKASAPRFTLAALAVLAAPGGCGRAPERGPLLAELTAAIGIDDTPAPWPDGTYRIPEISPSGVALFDRDGDGDLDIYQVCHPPPGRPADPAPNRLYLNEPDGRWRRAPDAAGLADRGYGNGVAVGDIDNDGDPDVYVANLGEDALYRNEGDGTFSEVTGRAGIYGEEWSTSAAFFDYDRDGHLDLWVSRYLVDDPSRVCRPRLGERRDYCGPSKYRSVADRLYRNEGGGSFVDVSSTAGILRPRASFGVVCVDLTGDGWVDVYVANDMQPNQLWVNRRDGTFADEAMDRGVALSGAGEAEAGMGIAVGDADGDGVLDLLVTHLVDQTNTLYVDEGTADAKGFFTDRSASSGLGGPSLGMTGWGCGFVDIDHDGDLDVAAVNGRIARGPVHPRAAAGPFWNDYAEPDQLFLGSGDGRFVDASEQGGAFTSHVEVSRGLAFGDLDGDGDVDLAMTNIGNGLRVFRNDAPAKESHWLRVRALTGSRDALGAVVEIRAAGRRFVRPLISTYSFQSASEPVAHFGLGGAARVEGIEVRWPDGAVERFGPSPADRTITVRQGEGMPR